MAALTTQRLGYPSSTVTYTAANAGGDTVTPGDTTRLVVKNASGGSINVTINRYPATDTEGVAQSALVVAVPAGAERWIGPLSGSRFANPSTGSVDIAYSAVTSVTVGVVAA